MKLDVILSSSHEEVLDERRERTCDSLSSWSCRQLGSWIVEQLVVLRVLNIVVEVFKCFVNLEVGSGASGTRKSFVAWPGQVFLI